MISEAIGWNSGGSVQSETASDGAAGRISGVSLPARPAWLAKFQFRSVLLASAALALVAGGASAAPDIGAHTANTTPFFHKIKDAKLLYSQNSNAFNYGVDSQNFTSGSLTSENDSAADDFVAPTGKTWTVSEVNVTGFYYNGSGPASSVDVIFYKNSKNMPGKAVKGGTFEGLSCYDDYGPFGCQLGKGVKLKAGHYWVAVVANCAFDNGCGQWA
ncbi:MAG TPA: hypothetical protein VMF67_06200 [Rhizomicrobium sp.]|nr:hypothetical protein [Rhizomicrobium sp.]